MPVRGTPGSALTTPLREAKLVATGAAARNVLDFLHTQRPPFLPVGSGSSRGPASQTMLTIEFTAPSPLGLLQAQS